MFALSRLLLTLTYLCQKTGFATIINLSSMICFESKGGLPDYEASPVLVHLR
jgi:hypothetical protein